MAVLVAVSLYFIIPPGVKTRLGLDLQGGLEIVYQAKTADGKAPSTAELDQTIGILDRRVNGLGVTESAIQKQGTDQISVALPGVKDAQQALDLIGKTAQLEFYKDDPQSRPVGPVATQGRGPQAAQEPGRLPGGDRPAFRGGQHRQVRARAAAGRSRARASPRQWYVYQAPAGAHRRGDLRSPRRLQRPDQQAQRPHRLHRRRQQEVPGDHARAVSHRVSSRTRRRRSPSCSTTSWSRTR